MLEESEASSLPLDTFLNGSADETGLSSRRSGSSAHDSHYREGSIDRKSTKPDVRDKLKNNELLDSKEQDDLINEIAQEGDRLNYLWKVVLLTAAILLFCTMAFSAVSLYLFPNLLSLHNKLEPLLGRTPLLLLHSLSALAYVACGTFTFALPYPSDLRFLQALVSTCVACAIWVLLLFIRKAEFTANTAALPIANIMFFLVCWYASYNSKNVSESVKKLAQYKYKYTTL